MGLIKIIICALFHKLDYAEGKTKFGPDVVLVRCHKCKRAWDTLSPVGHSSWHEIKYEEE